jgi:lysophospholipase L1-like esterase
VRGRPAKRLLLVSLLTVAITAACADATERSATSTTTSAAAAGRPALAGSTDQSRVARSQLSQLPAFADVPWADAMKVEQDAYSGLGKPPSRYGPLSLPDATGTYLNVANHERVTRRAPCAGCPHRVVWLSGNSAAFGYGQRDDHTIASDLSQLGADAGIDLEVRNLGQPGTAFFDEVPWLEAHLRLDREPPDLVVVYDGFNDVLMCYMHAIMRNGALLDPVTYYDQPSAKEYQQLDPPPDLRNDLVEPVAGHVASEYRSTQARLTALMGARGIPVDYFFQPDAFVSPLQAEGLSKSLNRTMAELIDRNNLAKLLEDVAQRLAPEVHDLRPLLRDFDRPVFADPAHMNETGARVVAEAIFGVIEDQLRR